MTAFLVIEKQTRRDDGSVNNEQEDAIGAGRLNELGGFYKNLFIRLIPRAGF